MNTQRYPDLDYGRLQVLAAYLRSQVALADRPPVGRVELNNEEATLCAVVLERFLDERNAQ